MDPNPYAPTPIPDALPAATGPPDRRLPFSGTVDFDDVAKLGQSKALGGVAAFLLLLGTAFVSLMLAAIVLIPTLAGATDRIMMLGVSGVLALLGMALLLLGGPSYLLASARGRSHARRLLKRCPQILGPIEGQIGNDLFEVAGENARTRLPFAGLTGVRLTANEILLTVDVMQQRPILLPARLFEPGDFELACDRLADLAGERPWRPSDIARMDPRLGDGEPLELFETAEPGIRFDGTVYAYDVKETTLYRDQVRRATKAFVRLVVILFVVVTAVGLIAAPTSLVYWLLVWPLPLAIIALSWSLARRGKTVDDQPLARYSGRLADDLLTLNSTLGSTIYRRSAFTDAMLEDGVLVLRLAGEPYHAVLLTRAMFSSADDFRQICRWAGVSDVERIE